MSTYLDRDFVAFVEQQLENAPTMRPAALTEVLTRVVATPQRRRHRWPTWTEDHLGPRLGAASAAAAAVVVALFGGFLLVAQPFDRAAVTVPGAETEGLPPVAGPAGNGLIAFARDGDILVGDVTTEKSEVIVSGPKYDMEPVFSPDGSRLAFKRYHVNPRDTGSWHPSLVVVRTDGSDERVIRPAPREFLWTPDGRSLVMYERDASSGTLTLLDPSGMAPPRKVSLPTLDLRWAGGPFVGYSHVAMFMRPPLGDRILAYTIDGRPPYLDLMDADGSNVRRLVDEAWLMEHGLTGLGGLWAPKWSPDGSRITFSAIADGQERVVVMDADGNDAQLIGGGASADPDWSPDGAWIKVRRPGCGAPDDCDALIIIDLVTGVERELVVTDSIGWSTWSPDGESVLYTSGDQGRLYTVDVETGGVTELPWETQDTWPGPSWQRVATD